MAVVMNKQLGFIVEGGYKATDNTVKPGQFVTVDHEKKEATIASDGAGVKLVLQRNDTIDQEAVADSDVVYKKDQFLPLRTLQLGDVFTTDVFTGTYENIKPNDTFVVGANGIVGPNTLVAGEVGFVVKEKTTLFGKPALKLEVVQIQ